MLNEIELLSRKLYEIDQFQNPFAHWTLAAFQSELEAENSKKLILYNQEKIAAFILFRTILNEAWIMNFAVKEKRLGWGAKALRLLEEKLGAECPEINEICLEVNEENIPAIELYQKFGFIKLQLRKGYYNQGRSSAWVMKKCL